MNRHLLDTFKSQDERSLFTLIENRTSYSFDRCELNVFETHQSVEDVNLVFDHFVLTSMLRGRKVMKLGQKAPFDYLPGESVILPPGELMNIDFPEARRGNPTQCIALTISDEVIRKTVELLEEYHPKGDSWGNWQIDAENFHLTNNQELADTINRIIKISKSERGKVKDVIVELTLREMLVRLMQTQARELFEKSYKHLSTNNALAASINFVKNNLTSKIDLGKLSEKACMSRASFFKKFKETMGLTPSQYIIKERIKLAKSKLQNSKVSITDVCFASGFENLSHFIKTFKNETGKTPKAWKMSKAEY